MKPINTLLALLFISLLSSPSWSEEMDDLVKRDGIYYQKFTMVPWRAFINWVTMVPFTGEVTGAEQGSIKEGKKDGAWVKYWNDGQLWYKGNYKNFKKEGTWVNYHSNGQLLSKGNYKNGKTEGAWLYYREDGTVWTIKFSGTYKDDVKISD